MVRHTWIWVGLSSLIAFMFVRLPQMAAQQDALLNRYSALVEVDALAKQQFVEPFVDDRLVEGAIRGMMQQLDPYSGYIAPHELASFERRTNGDYIGVGLEIGMVDGVPTVIAPIEGSPAARVGVQPGDVILAVNDTESAGLSVFDIEERLGGAPGSPVRLRVERGDLEEPIELTLVRGPVSVETVRGFRREAAGAWSFLIESDPPIGYVRVSNFCNHTMQEFDESLSRLHDRGARGMVLDLRFNPGGLMQQAVELVDRFVADGLILATVTRRAAVQEFYARAADTVSDWPLAVLINRSSASSAEIVAGALQDHGRAVIVGERSFGKGSVQHLIHLTSQKAAVKLTVAYYRLPGGRLIHKTAENASLDTWGVKPDEAVSLTPQERKQVQEARRALDTRFGPQAAGAEAGTAGTDAEPDAAIPLDPQLAAALRRVRSAVLAQPSDTKSSASPG